MPWFSCVWSARSAFLRRAASRVDCLASHAHIMCAKKEPICTCQLLVCATPYGANAFYNENYIEPTMKLFTGLKKIREFERVQLPFLKSVIDFDILVEIGYAEEQGKPLTLKQLFLLNVSSRTTVRRKLTRLIAQGIVGQRKHAKDQRTRLLIISSSTVKLLTKYVGALKTISGLHFK
jgi:hypothetical protein